MSKDEAIQTIIEILKEMERAISEEANITAKTVPIGALKCFDSLASVAATIDCLVRFDLESDVQSLFIDKDRALSVEEAADKLVEISKHNK